MPLYSDKIGSRFLGTALSIAKLKSRWFPVASRRFTIAVPVVALASAALLSMISGPVLTSAHEWVESCSTLSVESHSGECDHAETQSPAGPGPIAPAHDSDHCVVCHLILASAGIELIRPPTIQVAAAIPLSLIPEVSAAAHPRAELGSHPARAPPSC